MMEEPNRVILPPGPPSYLGAATCEECWEPFGSSILGMRFDRWSHRRKWGHDPVGYATLSDSERHQELVAMRERARRRQ